MTTKVTKESLAARIQEMEWRMSIGVTLSLKEEYQLAAYRMLLEYMETENQ